MSKFLSLSRSLASELIHDEPIMAIDVNPKEAGIVTGSADKSLLYSRVKPNAPPKDKSLKPLHVSTLASADEISVPLQSRTRSLLSESFAWSNDLNNFGGSNSSIYHTTAAGSNKEDHHEGPLNIIKKFNFHLPKEGNCGYAVQCSVIIFTLIINNILSL